MKKRDSSKFATNGFVASFLSKVQLSKCLYINLSGYKTSNTIDRQFFGQFVAIFVWIKEQVY